MVSMLESWRNSRYNNAGICQIARLTCQEAFSGAVSILFIFTGRVFMKLNGTHKFKANSWQVFNAIINPSVLQNCIPGCNSVEILDPTRIKANITTPLPGLKGPFGVVINMAQRQDPNLLVLEVKRKGTGGTVKA